MAPPRVALVGGGYAGMAAAVELACGGADVTVFEAGPTLGGRARSLHRAGIELDNGQHLLVGAYRETLRLMALVGVAPERALLRLPLTLRLPGELELSAPRWPAPWHLLAALVGARGFNLGERLAAIAFMYRRRAEGFALDEDQTVEALLERERQPPRLRRLLWHPLCIAALNTPPQRASARVFLAVLRDTLAAGREDSDLLIPRVGLSELFPAPAAAFIARRGGRVRTGRAVRHIGRHPDGFRIDADQRSWDHLVLAVAPHQLARLLAPLSPNDPALAQVAAFGYEPILTAYLDYGQPLRTAAPMLGAVAGAAQWVFDRGRLGGPRGLAAAVISASRSQLGGDADALAAQIDQEIRPLLGVAGAPRRWQVITEKRATFACTPGLARPSLRSAVPGLWLAGDYVDSPYPPTLEAAVRSGVACARAILAGTG